MQALKVIAAIFISFALLIVQGMLMSTFVLDKSISPESTTKAMKESDFAAQVYDDVASDDTNALVQTYIKKLLRSNTAAKAMGNYVSKTASGILYGTEYSAFTKADLMTLTKDSLNEVSGESGVSLSKTQKGMILKYIEENANHIVKGMNVAFPVPDKNISAAYLMQHLQSFLSIPMRIILSLVTLLLGGALIALFWKSKLGFIWWAFASALCGVMFLSSSLLVDILLLSTQVQTGATVLSILIASMVQTGSTFVGIISVAWSILLIILCIILRKVIRTPPL